jgi:nucleoside-diphosphate-sugar epimerase
LSIITKRATVLVTGADGFIGSHLTEALVQSGFKVRAFVYYNSFNSWGWLDRCADDVKGHFEVFPGDIRDPHGVKEAMIGGSEVELHRAEQTKAEEIVGRRPKYSGRGDFKHGLTETIDWFRKVENLRGFKSEIYSD